MHFFLSINHGFWDSLRGSRLVTEISLVYSSILVESFCRCLAATFSMFATELNFQCNLVFFFNEDEVYSSCLQPYKCVGSLLQIVVNTINIFLPYY